MSQNMSKCVIAYAFNSAFNLAIFLEENTFEENNMFLAEIKPREDKKKEKYYPYMGSTVALCIIKADKDLSGSLRLATHTFNIEKMKNGMDNFYATKRVKGSDIIEWVNGLDPKAPFPKLPVCKRTLTDLEIEQRGYAGSGKATKAKVENLEAILKQKDEEIQLLHQRIDECNDEIEKLEAGDEEYDMYKAFFEKFKNATKAKEWINAYNSY